MEAVNPSSGNQDLLQDLDEIVVLNPATQGQRFANYIIDLIIAYAFAFLLLLMLELIVDMMGGNGDQILGETVVSYLAMYIALIWYYTMLEAINKGRTIGKLITGTYAVASDGKPLTWKAAFYRSLCRIVPFEPFSGFSDAPWHDKWTQTVVVKK
jgi:uncharacterized RDD family membrane protein YckC